MKGTIITLICSALLLTCVWWIKQHSPFDGMQIERVTSTGRAASTAISPDGHHVAFNQREPDGKESLWVQQINTDGAVQIIRAGDVSYSGLAFSRDGKLIYFLSKEKNKSTAPALYRMPALGGTPQKLLSRLNSSYVISPDDQRLAYIGNFDNADSALVIVDLNSMQERMIATRKQPNIFQNSRMAWSPEGRSIACSIINTGSDGSRYQSLISLDLTTGQERLLGDERWRYLGDIVWLPDNNGWMIIAGSVDDSSDQLWYVSPSGGPRRVTNDLNRYTGLSMTADGRTIATVLAEDPLNIWIAPADDLSKPRQITRGAGRYFYPSWTPDGMVVTDSEVNGAREIWKLSTEGRAVQLTSRNQRKAAPVITPDGRHLVALSSRNGRLNIWRSDLDGDNPLQLTNGEMDNHPAVSPDGNWVFYESMVAGRWTIWKVGIEGGRPLQFVSTGNVNSPTVSPENRFLAYRHTDPESGRSRMVVIPIEGGEPVKTFDLPPTAGGLLRWTHNGEGLTFIDDRAGASEIWLQPLEGGEPRQLTNFGSAKIAWFSWSSDGKYLAVSRGAKASDVVLIDKLR